MIRVLVVHPGTQHAFRLATELHRLDALAGLHTGFAAGAGGGWERVIRRFPLGLRRFVSNRMAGGVPARFVHLQVGLELASQVRLRRAVGDGQGVLHWRNERFQRAVPERALAEADVVIGFDTSSWILAQRCRALGKPLVMVQTIGHPDAMAKIAEQLAAQFPEWEPTWERRLPPVREAEQIEHDATTLIVGSSRFTRQTLIDHGVAADKICVLPHGVDCARYTVAGERGNRPFRFVFVGSVSGRKGVPLLLEAWRRLRPAGAELWVVGPIASAVRKLVPELPGLRLWGEVPGVEVPGILQQCDVMVFPSYFEGFGLVILQAMACGLPVITTAATAGPDLIPTPGAGGWIVPTGDLQRLTEAMEHCLAHQEEMPAVGKIARASAERFNWQVYGRNWLPVLAEAVQRVAAAAARAPSGNGCPPDARSRPPDILLAHPGTQYSFRLAAELHQRGRLTEFHTGLAISRDGLVGRGWSWLPPGVQRQLANRRLEGVPATLVHLYPVGELVALFKQRHGGEGEQILHERNERFQKAIPQRAIEQAAALIGFDTSAWILARRCQLAGVPLILDQSIGHPDSKLGIYQQVRAEFPDWSTGLEQRLARVREAEQIEHELARLVVAASTFTQRTLVEHGVDPGKIRLNPYGVDTSRFGPKPDAGVRPLRFVFVGSVTARKGVPLLLKAWERLKPTGAELWILGPVANHIRRLIPNQPDIRVVGGVPHRDVPALLQQCDVFVFPSYFEGFGLVILEAMACGLPVITTTATAGPDIFQSGEGGWITAPGDLAALMAAMDRCLTNPAGVRAMGGTARQIAERNSWSAYGERWASILDSLRN